MSRLPPATPEQRARSARLMTLVAASRAAHKALSPVDRALVDIAPRNSFVRAEVDDAAVLKFNDPASTLAAEVRRLRTRVKELEIIIHEDARCPYPDVQDVGAQADAAQGAEAEG